MALSKDFKRARKIPSIKDRYNTKTAKQYNQSHLTRVENLYKSFEEKLKEQAAKSASENNPDDRSSRKQDPIGKTHGVDDSQPRAAKAGTILLGIPLAGKVLNSITSGIKETIGFGGQQVMNSKKPMQQILPTKPIPRHELKNTEPSTIQQRSQPKPIPTKPIPRHEVKNPEPSTIQRSQPKPIPTKPIPRHEMKNTEPSTIQRSQPKPILETRVEIDDVEKSASLFMSRMNELGLNADTGSGTGSGSDGTISRRGRKINNKQRRRVRTMVQTSRQSTALQSKKNELHIEPLGALRRNVQIREDQNVDVHAHNNSNRSLQREDSDRDKFVERMRRSSSNRPDARQRGVTMIPQSNPRAEFASSSLSPPSSSRYLQSTSNVQSGVTKRKSTNKRSSMDTSLAIVVDEPKLGADSQVPNAVIPELMDRNNPIWKRVVHQNVDSREYRGNGESFRNNNIPHPHHNHEPNRNRPHQTATRQYPQNMEPIRRQGIPLEPGRNETLIRSRNQNISQSNRHLQEVVPRGEVSRPRSSVELAQDPRSSNNRFQINVGTRVTPHQDPMNKFTRSSVNGFSTRNINVSSSNRAESAYEQRNFEKSSLFNTTLRRNVNSQLHVQRN